MRDILSELERKILWLSTWTIHNANHLRAEEDAIKVGGHAGRHTTTAADRDFLVDPAARAEVTSFVGRRVPGLNPVPVNEVTCLYTWTANEDFVLDRSGPFVVASPCSGHGAKFAPLLGEIIADLAAGKPAPDPRFTLAAHGVARG